ncbi:TetR/AcrR family transcriptional regulator [Mycobacterium hubeiense]|uniref:TetR/AcrR family transcriptional regulator n=1 Tax=Mycobacterium hubeiense TaxID=1867256 RepID=UPI000C7F760C|nr:TetR/AcrR family transcriptional regulator [Mycobacterium sp. QGD 101]
MVRPAQTARSERTREALRRAAVVRFLAQGVENTSAEQIAADAGVSLRTFYRHFASKHDLLFADYAGLQWFRAALAARDPDEPIIEAVYTAIMARPYEDWAVAQTAALRAQELEPGRIARHMRQVEADFADAIKQHLADGHPPTPGTDEGMQITVTARCIAAAVFGAMEAWMLGQERSLPELTRLTREALDSLAEGIPNKFRHN